MPKLCQLIAAFWVVCVIVVLAPLAAMPAPPAATTPPAGAAWPLAPKHIIRETASALAVKGARCTSVPAPLADLLPLPAISEIATQVPVFSLRTDR